MYKFATNNGNTNLSRFFFTSIFTATKLFYKVGGPLRRQNHVRIRLCVLFS